MNLPVVRCGIRVQGLLACLVFLGTPSVAQTVRATPVASGSGASVAVHAEQDMAVPMTAPPTLSAAPMTMPGDAQPATGRSSDDSEGIAMSPLGGMDMHDHDMRSMLLIDQLEGFYGQGPDGLAWEAEGWYGGDTDKVWFRTEGDRRAGHVEQADLEVLWAHAVAVYWDTQWGVRRDAGSGSGRNWLAFGIQGLAPYWFEIEATAYVSNAGHVAARLRTQYELRLTQRWMLQPEFEADLYSGNEPRRRMGDGSSELRLGLRLRYEVTRQFAPYVGLVWARRFGTSADDPRQAREPVFDRQVVAGVRFWF